MLNKCFIKISLFVDSPSIQVILHQYGTTTSTIFFIFLFHELIKYFWYLFVWICKNCVWISYRCQIQKFKCDSESEIHELFLWYGVEYSCCRFTKEWMKWKHLSSKILTITLIWRAALLTSVFSFETFPTFTFYLRVT